MEFSDFEFANLTSKLENYAAKVSALEARLEMQMKENVMKQEYRVAQMELEACRSEISMLREELAAKEERCQMLECDCERYQEENQRLTETVNAAAVENAFLKNCLLISIPSIRKFAKLIKHVELRALVYTFLVKTMSPLMGSRGLEAVNEAIEISDGYDMEKLADQLVVGNDGTVSYQK